MKISEMSQDQKLFEHINPETIKKGMLGNGYFLSALAAIAEIPERIERIFLEGSFENE